LIIWVIFVASHDCQRFTFGHPAAPAPPNIYPMKPSPSPALARPVVLVTGAAKRLGREIALALAAGGWQVAVHYRSSAKEALKTVADCARLAGSSAAFDADLADEAAVRGLLARVVAHFGRVHAVVNSASTFEHDSAASFGFASLDKHLHSNTGAAVLLAQALHAHVVSRQAAGAATAHAGRCAVVNLLDQKLWNQNPDFFSYTLSKAALEAAGTMLAMALAPQVRVVGVAPGLTLTSHLLTNEQFEARHKLSPLGRSSTPADVAATVKFALENASITGTTLLVDGGQHLMKFDRDFSLM
jgi:NAD(P)-dependent dehydrogenase (short-subunit alcohol dehydrogenase family)